MKETFNEFAQSTHYNILRHLRLEGKARLGILQQLEDVWQFCFIVEGEVRGRRFLILRQVLLIIFDI